MKGTLTVIKADGTVTDETLGEATTFDSLYQKLKDGMDGGPLEAVPLFPEYDGEPCIVFCDEEGRMKGLQANATATKLWHTGIRANGRNPSKVLTATDYIVGLVGPIVIVRGDDELLAIV
jgi:hypothetical protein